MHTVPTLLLLILVPIAAWLWAKRHRPSQLWRITGAAFGAIIYPSSLGFFYATFVASPLGPVPSLIGHIPAWFHGAPGYEIATSIGFVESHKELEGIDYIWISGVNAIVWGIAYGALGWLVDRHLAEKRRNKSA